MERWVEEAQDDVAELVVLSLLAGEVQTPEIDGGRRRLIQAGHELEPAREGIQNWTGIRLLQITATLPNWTEKPGVVRTIGSMWGGSRRT